MKIEDSHFDLPTETGDEENWDLEKWRKEHPMDYFKALHILNMSDDSIVKAEVFKAIYRVIRMHIPDVLYKYYSLSDSESETINPRIKGFEFELTTDQHVSNAAGKNGQVCFYPTKKALESTAVEYSKPYIYSF